MSLKKQLAQFFTTNHDYILSNFKEEFKSNTTILRAVENLDIVEPFAGSGELLKWLDKIDNFNISDHFVELFDKDIQNEVYKNYNVVLRDTLMNPPDYKDKLVITNPPYLALNKSSKLSNYADIKQICDKYKQDDLYKCFIKSLIIDKPAVGIIIIPLNFLSSIRKNDIDLRLEFFSNFYIKNINIFNEQVFQDTKYSVCAIQFYSLEKYIECEVFKNSIIRIYKNKVKEFEFNYNFKDCNLFNKNNYCLIGGEIYNTNIFNISKDIYINRLTKNNIDEDGITRILVKCIDDNSNRIISMKYIEESLENNEIYIDNTENLSARSFMTLIIRNQNIPLTEFQQKELVILFNNFLNNHRKKYYSLFLTNYRESSDIARKRISFNLVYNITNHIILNNF